MVAEEKLPHHVVLGLSLLLAVTVCSSAGVVFTALTSVDGVPPFLTVSWRFWCQEMIQLVPFLLSVRSAQLRDEEVRYRRCRGEEGGKSSMNEVSHPSSYSKPSLIFPRFVSSLPLLVTSGFFLGIHFAAWVYSLRHTSLVHSLLWVSMGPILINGGNWMIYIIGSCVVCEGYSRWCPKVQRPSWKETAGAFTGILGAVMMLLDVRSESSLIPGSEESSKVHEPTISGDIAAFIGAAAVSIYLIIGRKLRAWMPLWMYAFPVAGSAMMTNIVFAFMYSPDRALLKGLGRTSMFGFLNRKYFFMALYLGAGPGVCGHTMLNALLKYMSPLTISTAMLAEPLFGSLIGHYFGMQPIPGIWTLIGGSVLLVGLLFVVLGEKDSGKTADDTSIQDDSGQQLIKLSECEEAFAMPDPVEVQKQYGAIKS